MEAFAEKVKTICDLFYRSVHIPIYVYVQDQCRYSPTKEPLAAPPHRYIEQLLAQKDSVFYTEYGACFARLDADKDQSVHLILGPVATLAPQSSILYEMDRDYQIPAKQRERFRAFHLQLPTMTYLAFFYHLITVFYMLNNRVITIADLVPSPGSEAAQRARRQQTEEAFLQKEAQSYNNSMELEHLLLSIVKTGDAEGMRKFTNAAPRYQAGGIVETPLRLQKNYFISTITLVTRAAIEGGLPEEQAFRFSDLYIMKAETLSDLRSVNTLFLQALNDITVQVHAEQQAQLRLPLHEVSKLAQDCMDYVQKHTHSPLSVQDVADAMGYHRSYLSTAFTKAAGITLHEYTYRCKLEESYRLLQYTSKSISEISDTLCFANQSHFVQRFKKHYGVTPARFRAGL